MPDCSVDSLSNHECIQIIFKEYDTLRAEIIARTTGGFQLISIIALLSSALLAWAGSHSASKVLWVGVGVLCAASALFFYVAHRDVNMLASRVKEIEAEINHLAGDIELLKWETHSGAAVTGWIRRRPGI
jgi:hypothetical protein